MRGKVIMFDYQSRKGIIEDKKKNRYSFHIGEWLSEEKIQIGKEVEFEIPVVNEAINIRYKERNYYLKNLINRFNFIQGKMR